MSRCVATGFRESLGRAAPLHLLLTLIEHRLSAGSADATLIRTGPGGQRPGLGDMKKEVLTTCCMVS